MTVNSVQNAGYTQVTDNNGKVYLVPNEEAETSVFAAANKGQPFVSKQLDINVDSVDGSNDGKLSIGEAAKQAWKGVGDLVAAPVTEAAKGNFLPLIGTVVVGGAIALIGAPAAVAAGAIGLCVGGAKLASGISNAISAKTDAEAKSASREIGQGGFGVLASAAGVKGGLKEMKTNPKYEYSKLGEEATFGDKAGAYFKDLGNATKGALDKVNPFPGKGAGEQETPLDDGIDEEQMIKDIMDNTDEPTALTEGHLERIKAVDADDALAQMQEAQQELAEGVSFVLDESGPVIKPYEFPKMTAEEAAAIPKTGPTLAETNPDLAQQLLAQAQNNNEYLITDDSVLAKIQMVADLQDKVNLSWANKPSNRSADWTQWEVDNKALTAQLEEANAALQTLFT